MILKLSFEINFLIMCLIILVQIFNINSVSTLESTLTTANISEELNPNCTRTGVPVPGKNANCRLCRFGLDLNSDENSSDGLRCCTVYLRENEEYCSTYFDVAADRINPITIRLLTG